MGRIPLPGVHKIRIICPLLNKFLRNFTSLSGNKFLTQYIQIKLILGSNFYDKMQLYGILGQPSYMVKTFKNHFLKNHWHGGHLSHVTWTIYMYTYLRYPFKSRLHMNMKFGFDWPSGFREDKHNVNVAYSPLDCSVRDLTSIIKNVSLEAVKIIPFH